MNYDDVNLEKNQKLNVAINFLFLFFGIRIDQSIAFQVKKVPRGGDPSAKVPSRGGEGRGQGTEVGSKGLVLVQATCYRTRLS